MERRECINHLTSNEGIRETLSYNEWKLCESITKVLKLFKLVTNEISREDVTISCILPLVTNSFKWFDSFQEESRFGNLHGIRSFVKDLKMQMEKRFAPPEADSNYFYSIEAYHHCVCATLLDPRFKFWSSEIDLKRFF